MNATRWRLRPHDPGRVAALSREAQVAPIVAQLLINRGIDHPDLARRFLDTRLIGLHDPALLPGVVEAADRIRRAVAERRKIVIYGDYDVDGVCGTSVLWGCLRLAGATEVDYYIPHRVEEGYGVNPDALRKIATEHRASMVVTVDCGISAVKEARLARELGVEYIVTDHHTIGDELPGADVLVHPRLPGSRYPFGDLCGCGVAFKLAWEIAKGFGDGKKASPHLREYLLRALSLVALATVADLVPLADENRILVQNGLEGLRLRPSPGLRALMDVAGCLGRSQLSAGTVGFNLAPRINAAGRLERAMEAVELLTTEDDIRAGELARFLDECNMRRQQVERDIVAEAREMVQQSGGPDGRSTIVLAKEGWHPGVIGIVASRLVDAFHRPAIVIALQEGLGQGSARSIAGLNLFEALKACSEGLVGFGGHAAAAGLKLKADHLPEFARLFEAHCRGVLTPESLQRELVIDAEVPLGVLTPKVVAQIEAMEPFGQGNPRPLLVANRVQVVGAPRPVGAGGNHLQLRFAQGNVVAKAIAWNMAERGKKLTDGAACSLAFYPSINEWKGKREVQLEIKDFQVHEDARLEPVGVG